MAIIPSNAQFIGDTTGIPITEKGSSKTNDRVGIFTMADMKASVSDSTLVTYLELKALADSSSLVPGSKYLITDFQTLHIIPNTVDRNDANTVIPVDPLLLTAISINEFDARVQSLLYPKDEIYYDIDNTRWGVLVDTSSKGFITRRIDTELLIDVGQDFRHCVFRRWNADMSAYGSGDGVTYDNYVLHNTTVGVGRGFNSTVDATITFTALDPLDYRDYTMFNFSSSEVTRILIEGGLWWESPLANAVFTDSIDMVKIRAISNVTIDKKTTALNLNLFSYTIAPKTRYSLINSSDEYFSLGNTSSPKWVTENLLVYHLDTGYGELLGNLTSTAIFPHPDTADTAHNSGIKGTLGNLSKFCIRIKCTTGENHISITTRNINGGVKNTSFDIESNWRTRPVSIENYDFTVYTTFHISGMNFYKEGVYSDYEYTIAATATIAPDYTGFFAGIFNLTGASPISLSKIALKSGESTKMRVPLLLKPSSTLVLSVVNNNVDGGILTEGETYVADGSVGETIELKWYTTEKRYRVLRGRTL
jgi:hypothetical protein